MKHHPMCICQEHALQHEVEHLQTELKLAAARNAQLEGQLAEVKQRLATAISRLERIDNSGLLSG